MRKNSSFGRRGVFKCGICLRATREAGDNDGVCPECYELAGLDNSVNDTGRALTAEDTAERDRLVTKAAASGSDIERMKDAFSFLWPGKEAA